MIKAIINHSFCERFHPSEVPIFSQVLYLKNEFHYLNTKTDSLDFLGKNKKAKREKT
jgi:hypothetical protein